MPDSAWRLGTQIVLICDLTTMVSVQLVVAAPPKGLTACNAQSCFAVCETLVLSVRSCRVPILHCSAHLDGEPLLADAVTGASPWLQRELLAATSIAVEEPREEEMSEAVLSLTSATCLRAADSRLPPGRRVRYTACLRPEAWLSAMRHESPVRAAAASLALAAWCVAEPSAVARCIPLADFSSPFRAAVDNVGAATVCPVATGDTQSSPGPGSSLCDSSCLLIGAALALHAYPFRARIFLLNITLRQCDAIDLRWMGSVRRRMGSRWKT